MVYNDRLRNVRYTEVIKFGVLSNLDFTFGNQLLAAAGSYWPLKNMDGPSSLWNQVQSLTQLDPMIFVKAHSHNVIELHRQQNRESILGGDLNSDILRKDTLQLANFMDNLGLANASNLNEAQAPSYCSGLYSNRPTHFSRIDHIFYRGGNLESMICIPVDLPSLLQDHKPVVAVFRLRGEHIPFGRKMDRILPIGLNTRDKRVMREYECNLSMIDVSAASNSNQDNPVGLLLSLSQQTVEAAKDAMGKRHTKKRPHGMSPVCRILQLHLHLSIIIIRHTKYGRARNGPALWTKETYRTPFTTLLKKLRKAVKAVRLNTDERTALADIMQNHDETLWSQANWAGLSSFAVEIHTKFKKLLHGRKRKEFRLLMSARTQHMEDLRQQGQLRDTIKYLVGSKSENFTLEELMHEGAIITDPIKIHSIVTKFFHEWFELDKNGHEGGMATPGATLDDFNDTLEQFLDRYSGTNVPVELLQQLWTAFQTKVDPDSPTLQQFHCDIRKCPTLEEFQHVIRHSPRHTVGGMTGLNYDMTRSWSKDIVKAIHHALSTLFESRTIPEYWKWRWLVPIPKKVADPTLADLRPLTLIECLRKLWSGIFVNRCQTFWQADKTLNPSQNAYLRKKGTETATVIVANALETAREWLSNLYISSWDLKRAFDSISKPLLVHSWRRMGVPLDIAQYLVDMDIGGHTVVRTPFALKTLLHEGAEGIVRRALSFNAEKGTGQGDKTSPSFWNAVIDILFTTLASDPITGNDNFYIQTPNNQNTTVNDVAYADDIFSFQGTLQALQRKADIISAFCIVAGIQISVTKLRAFAVVWGNGNQHTTDQIMIHMGKWIPTQISMKSDGDFTQLGSRWNMDLGNDKAFTDAKDIIDLACSKIVTKRGSMGAKIQAIELCIQRKIAFYAKWMPWPLAWFRELDKHLARYYCEITRSNRNSSHEHLYMGKSSGGLGIRRLSSTAQISKLHLMHQMIAPAAGQEQNQAMLSLVNKGFRAEGKVPLPDTITTMGPPIIAQPNWVSSLRDYLEELSIGIKLNGSTRTDPLMELADSMVSDQFHICHDTKLTLHLLGIVTCGELYMEGDSEFMDQEINLQLSNNQHKYALLPRALFSCPIPTTSISLRTGQCWMKDDMRHSVLEIVGFQGDLIDYIIWQPATTTPLKIADKVFLQQSTTHDGFTKGSGTNNHRLPFAAFTESPMLQVLLSVDRHHTDGANSCQIIMIRPRTPRMINTLPKPAKLFPAPIQDMLRYAKEIFSDGSWKNDITIGEHLTGVNHIQTAGGLVALQMGIAPPLTLRVTFDESAHTDCVYPAEMITGLIGMHGTQHTNNPTPPVLNSDCMAFINTANNFNNGHTSNNIYSQLLLPLATLPPNNVHHVKGHPERPTKAKPATDTQPATPAQPGVKFKDFDQQQSAMRSADIIAGSESEVNYTITAHEVVDIVTTAMPFTLVDTTNGCPLIERVDKREERIQTANYLHRRDESRIKNNKTPKWVGSNPSLMQQMLMPKRAGLGTRCFGQRIGYDKHFNGSNRLKYFRNELHGECNLCGSPLEDQKHILLDCNHGQHGALRTDMLNALEAMHLELDVFESPSAKPVYAIIQLLKTHADRVGLYTGILSTTLRTAIMEHPELEKMYNGKVRSDVDALMRCIGTHTAKIISYHNHFAYETRKRIELGQTYHIKPYKAYTLKRNNGTPIHQVPTKPLLQPTYKSAVLDPARFITKRNIEYYLPTEEQDYSTDEETGEKKKASSHDICRGRIKASNAARHTTRNHDGTTIITQNEIRRQQGRQPIHTIPELDNSITRIDSHFKPHLSMRESTITKRNPSSDVTEIAAYSTNPKQLSITNFYRDSNTNRWRNHHPTSKRADKTANNTKKVNLKKTNANNIFHPDFRDTSAHQRAVAKRLRTRTTHRAHQRSQGLPPSPNLPLPFLTHPIHHPTQNVPLPMDPPTALPSWVTQAGHGNGIQLHHRRPADSRMSSRTLKRIDKRIEKCRSHTTGLRPPQRPPTSMAASLRLEWIHARSTQASPNALARHTAHGHVPPTNPSPPPPRPDLDPAGIG